MYHSFEELDVWKRACRLSVRVYEILKDCSDAGLKSQMTRAAVSVASNIAEGAERSSNADFARFLHIAKDLRQSCGRKHILPLQLTSCLKRIE